MIHQPPPGLFKGIHLVILLGVAVLVVMQLLAYQLWLSYQEQIGAAEISTRNYAAIFEARLDATLRRIDADLKALARETPAAALSAQAVPSFSSELNARLDSRLPNFKEIAGYRVTDAKGDTLYTSASAHTARINVSDRDYFQVLRDRPETNLVFSEVVTGRTTGRQVIAVARALRGAHGEFAGIAYGILELEHFQQMFQSLDLGPHGSIALRRSDTHALVVRHPHLPMEVNKTVSANNPVVQKMRTGDKLATLQFAAQTDGIQRIFSVHSLQHYPFLFIVGISRDDALAGWHKRATVVGISALLLLGLFAVLLLRLSRMRQHETRILTDLSQSEELFREMAEGIDQVYFKASADYSRFDYVSPAFDRIWGHSRAELISSPGAWIMWVHEQDRETLRQYIAENMHADSYSNEFRIVRTDGEVRWIRASAFRLGNSAASDEVVGFHSDVTLQKQVEESLEESQAKYRALSEAAFEAIFISENGIFIEQNSRAEQMFGYSSAEAIGCLGTQFIAPEHHALAMQNILAGHEQPYEVTAVRKDGSRFPSLVRGKMMEYKGRRVRVTSMSDISERKQAEQALRESEAYNKILFAASHIPLAVLDPEVGRLVDCNQALIDIYGLGSREAVLALSPADVATPLQYDGRSSAETAFEHLAPALRDGHHVFEWRHQRPDGHVWDAEVNLMAFEHNGKTLLQFSLQDISERKQVDAVLRRSEERFSQAFHSSPIAGSIARASDGCFIDANKNYERDFGWPREELIGRTSIEVRLWPDAEVRRPWAEILAREGRVVDWETTWLHRNGELRQVSISAETVELNGDLCILAYATDITARKQAEAEIRIAAAAFESQEGMFITDTAQRILRINRAGCEITGYAPAEVVGQTPHIFSSGRHDAVFFREMWASIQATGVWAGEMWNRRKNGDVYPSWMNISAVKGDGEVTSHFVAAIIDISRRKLAEDEIKYLAFYDPLTRLPNRRLLLDRLQHALIAGSRSENSGALLFIDLDNFKTLNDTLGHDKGDLLLASVAHRLTASVREGDTVARLGGDEFVVMLEGLSADLNDAAGEARLVGEKILYAFIEPHDLAGLMHYCTASVGIALFTHKMNTVDELLKRADLAMYQAKAAGRNTLRFFDPQMQSAVMARAALEADLREGIQRDELILYYQSQVDDLGHITGAEALLRWRHPQRGMISPLEFIPLAEESGLILPVGNWVLETACAQLREWAGRTATAHLTLSVNVSAKQFRAADFVDQILAILARSGAAARQLKLELTESLLLDDVEGMIAKMTLLKLHGVGFSLDDFGTGYSSLSYLKRLPLDQLKIDQSFVRDLLTDPNDAAIARTIVALGQSMGLTVIAEGVETIEQRDLLASQGCLNYQGYLFGRPVPAEEFAQLLNQV